MPNKTFNNAKKVKYDEYQCVLALMVYILFFDKNTLGGVIKKNMQTGELAAELHKSLENLRKEKYTRLL